MELTMDNRELDARLRAALPILRRDRSMPATMRDTILRSAIAKAIATAHRFKEGSFTAWLFTIYRNKGRDRLRHRKRHPVAPADEGSPADGPTAEELLGDLVNRDLVQRALAKLDPRQRELLELRYGRGEGRLSEREVGLRVGLNREQARVALRQAVQALRALLPEDFTP